MIKKRVLRNKMDHKPKEKELPSQPQETKITTKQCSFPENMQEIIMTSIPVEVTLWSFPLPGTKKTKIFSNSKFCFSLFPQQPNGQPFLANNLLPLNASISSFFFSRKKKWAYQSTLRLHVQITRRRHEACDFTHQTEKENSENQRMRELTISAWSSSRYARSTAL